MFGQERLVMLVLALASVSSGIAVSAVRWEVGPFVVGVVTGIFVLVAFSVYESP